MSEAPERIWADTAYGKTCGVDWSVGKAFQQDIEYRRADLPPTLSAAMELPEVRALVSQLEAWLEVAKHCSITEGVCCCGDNMKGHADPMDCGHTSTDHGTYHAHMLVKSTQSALAAIKEPKT